VPEPVAPEIVDANAKLDRAAAEYIAAALELATVFHVQGLAATHHKRLMREFGEMAAIVGRNAVFAFRDGLAGTLKVAGEGETRVH